MSNIANMLRALANDVEQAELHNKEELDKKFNQLYAMIADVEVRAHGTEDKLQRVGKILMED